MGFACIEVALYLRGVSFFGVAHASARTAAIRAGFAALARGLVGAAWGYALGHSDADLERQPGRRLRVPGRGFWLAFGAVTLLRGLHDHLLFGRGLAALLGSIPLLLGMIFVAYGMARELDPELSRRSRHLGFFPSMPPPPSFGAMRDALRRAERPVMLHWIALGMLVTMGVVMVSVVVAVLVGRRAGVDFGAVDEGELTGAVPLALVGLGALVGFLASGYLLARASAAESVLEPALGVAMAIVAALVLLGLAAPVALVFALAFAPIAFGLACAGAWVGIGAAVHRPGPPRPQRQRG
jgi:hypothetical protein